MRRGFDARRSIGHQPDPRRRGRHLGRVAGHGASPSDQPIAVAHRPGSLVALGPAEGARGLIEAGHDRAACIGQALDGLVHGVIDTAQFDRVHVERDRQFVHGAFESIDVRGFGRGTHEPRRAAIGTHDGYAAGDIGNRIHPGRSVRARNAVGIGPRRDLEPVMRERLELAVARGSEPDAMARLGPVGRDRKSLASRRNQLYGPSKPACGHGDQRGALGQRALGTECAPHERADDPDTAGIDAQLLSHAAPDPVNGLTWLIDGQLRPDHTHVVVNSSIGLWCCVGVE